MNRAQRRGHAKTKRSNPRLGLSLVAATALATGNLSAITLPAKASGICSAVTNEGDLQDCIDGSEQVITITQSFTLENGDIEIDRDVTIQGSNSSIYIDGGTIFDEDGDIDTPGSRIFYSYVDGDPINVTFQNLTLKNGSTGGSGGLIAANNTNLEIINMIFEDSFSTFGGGAVWLFEGNLTVDNSTFNDNRSVNVGGGAIYSFDSDATIRNSTFEDNHSILDRGGALFFAGFGSLTIENSTFTENTSRSNGGAVYIDIRSSGVGNNFVIRDSNFDENNSLSGRGGALYVDISARENTLTITNTTFNENSSDSQGGAIYMDSNREYNPFTITNSTFTKNVSRSSRGGALYVDMNRQLYSPVNITGSLFSENSAFTTGGAIYVDSGDEISINNSTFDTNSSGGGGGAVYLENVNSFSIANSSFTNNYNDDNFPGPYEYHNGRGGAVYVNDAGLFTTVNTTFSGNNAKLIGGAIFTRGVGDSEILFSTFVNNSADALDSGQSIHIDGSNDLKLFGNIFASSLSTNNQSQLYIEDELSSVLDLGYNFSSNSNDRPLLESDTSQMVAYDDLGLSPIPATDANYPNTTPVIAINSPSPVVDVITQEAFNAAREELIGFSENSLNPENFTDQRGFVRTFNFDAGAYEAQARAQEIIPIVKKIVLPAAPSRVEVKSAGRRALKVSWSLPTSSGTGRILRYEIYRNGKRIATVPASNRSFRDSKLEKNSSYTYQVVTVGTQGKSIKSRFSFSKFVRR